MKIIIDVEKLRLRNKFHVMTELTNCFPTCSEKSGKNKVLVFLKETGICNDKEPYIVRSKERLSHSDNFEFEIDIDNDGSKKREYEKEYYKGRLKKYEFEKYNYECKKKKCEFDLNEWEDELKKLENELKEQAFKNEDKFPTDDKSKEIKRRKERYEELKRQFEEKKKFYSHEVKIWSSDLNKLEYELECHEYDICKLDREIKSHT